LTAKPIQTFGELAASAKGVYSGQRDLSSREGFGSEHIVDTGPLAGWINRCDRWHAWSVSVMEGLTHP